VETSGDFDVVAGVADVIVVWNIFEHFWPYWNDISVDWRAALDTALADALDDRSMADHVATMERLGAIAPDGHASTFCPGMPDTAALPFALDGIEGRVVVTASSDQAIKRGDVLVSVDGQPVEQLLARDRAQISGSPQWQRVRGLQRLGRGAPDSRAAVTVRRGTNTLEVTVTRTAAAMREPPPHASIDRLDDGVYYVDLRRAPMSELNAAIDKLAAAPGVVFDLRGRPNANHQILSHLLTRPDDASAWMAVPRIIRPDSAASPASWKTEGWNLPVLQPHIGGRVAFLTDASAISYTESVMGLVDYYRLGAIVGSATAGSNGDVAQIATPMGCEAAFTGGRVTKPDGSRHYLVGIQPTIPAARTLAGVLAGRDEVLDRALAYVRGAP
jgi:C-terminal processing protease CtpA/Prc